MGDGIEDRAPEGRQIPAALGQRRDSRVGIVRIARVVAVVVGKEKCARAVHELGNRQRPSDCRREPLLQVIRLRRRLTVQRVGRRVERGRVEGVGQAAANPIALACASEAPKAAGSSSLSESAGSSRSAGAARSTAPATRSAGPSERPDISAKRIPESARPARSKRGRGLSAYGGDRFGGSFCREARGQEKLRSSGVAARLVWTRAVLIGEQFEATERRGRT